jgi:ribonuclease T2
VACLMRRFRAVMLALMLFPALAAAQGYGRGGTPGDFDFYVLALSWSPTFCATGGQDRAPRQCHDGAGLGFVVHGLWPQYVSGYPSDCTFGSGNPSRIALESARGLYPDEGLARHEWRKHGTCSGLAPAAYFDAVRAARDKVTVPASLTSADTGTSFTARDVERAFADANRGLRPDMISLSCRRNMLEEVRICLSRDLRSFVTCPQVDRAGCRSRDISLPAPR